MRYSIYKITNRLNNKIYIGAHATQNISDNYMGSGTILKKAFKKYGIENFDKDILYTFETEEDMYLKEAELVNEDFIQREDTYNLKLGGFGGWTYINKNRLNQTEKNRKSCLKNLEKANEANAKKVKEGTHRKGFTHSDETKAKMSKHPNRSHKGETNPSFGKKWFNKNNKNELILEIDFEKYIADGWVKGMKQNKPGNKGIKNPSFGKSWYTNGSENKLSSEKDSLDLISKGWTKGRTLKKKS